MRTQQSDLPMYIKNDLGQDMVLDHDGQYVLVELAEKKPSEERANQQPRPERQDRGDRPERSDRPERNDRNDRRPNNNQQRSAPGPQFSNKNQPKFQPNGPQPLQLKKQDSTDANQKKIFSTLIEDLVGTKAACVLDDGLNVLGKVPISELDITLKSLSTGVYAVIFDGTIDRAIVNAARNTSLQYIVGMDSKVKPNETKIRLLTVSDL